MIVCSCRVLTDRDFVGTLATEPPGCPRSPVQAYKCLGCSPECGRCLRMVKRILADARASHACTDCVSPCTLRSAMHTDRETLEIAA